MTVKRIELKPLAVQRIFTNIGASELTPLEYGLTLALAALARSLPENKLSTTAIVVPLSAFRELATEGAWVEIDDERNGLMVKVTLK